MAGKKETFVIFDAHALIHRSFHALPPLTTTKGEMVNAVFGFANVLLKVMRELKPTYVAAAFDLAAPTFRHKEYEQYKATRVKAPQDLYDQIPRVKELVQAFSIPIYEQEGFEADDVIGTVAEKLTGRPINLVIVTGDMDTLQLVNEQVKVSTLKQGVGETVKYGPTEVRERYGLDPNQMVDYKALRGDPSDNIPGVRGIGEKTAVELLQLFGSVDAVYTAIDKNSPKLKKIKPRVLELLKASEKDALLSKKLATIVRTVPIDFVLANTRAHEYDRQKVIELFQELEFKSLLAKLPTLSLFQTAQLPSTVPARRKTSDAVYTLVDDDRAFTTFLTALKKQHRFALDTETTDLNPVDARLLGMSFCWKAGDAFYLNLNRPDVDQWIAKLQPILEDPTIEKYGHNLKYDYQILKSVGVTVTPLSFDSMIASYLLNPGSRQHSLDSLAFTEFGYEMMPITDLIGPKGKAQTAMSDVPLDKLSWYASEDADYTWRLVEKLRPDLAAHQLESVFEKIEMPLVAVLADMELTGVRISSTFLDRMARRVKKQLADLESKIYEHAGTPFNIQSPAQLKTVLFEKLNISAVGIGKTKTGLSTAAAELEKLRDAHPMIPLLFEYRELSKLLSTYLVALPTLVNERTGRVHTDFNQTIAATGRLSSSNPNLQNIPTRTPLGHEIRKAFVADRGFRLVSADYSQIELRIVAALAHDETMIETFRRGEDIHARTAALINNVPLEKVTKQMRYAAKEVNFGVLYGMGAWGLASRTGLSRDEARRFIDTYFRVYQGVAAYLEQTKALARSRGYVETLFGRRRPVPEIASRNPQLRSAAERMAVNMPVQGTAADLMKLAMVAIQRGLPAVSSRSRMILQVHDELVFEVPTKDVERVAAFAQETMATVEKLPVPIVVEVSSGMNWGELLPLETKAPVHRGPGRGSKRAVG